MAYTRRGFKGGARSTTLNGDLNDSATTVPVAASGLSTWAGGTANGLMTFTINLGRSDEEQCTAGGISGDSLTSVTRGTGGTTAQRHDSGATITHTSSVTDYDEANAHIADTTLDHHTQYARTDGTRTITGAETITRTSDGYSFNVTRAAATLQGGSVIIGRDSVAKPQSLSFQVGTAVSMNLGRAASSDNLEIGNYNGTTYAKLFQFGTDGQMAAVGQGHGFGIGALGAAGAYAEIDGTATEVYLQAKGTPTNVPLILRSKGSHVIQFQDATGLERGSFVGDAAVAASNTALLLRMNIGGVYSVKQVLVDSADSGGAGFRRLLVTN